MMRILWVSNKQNAPTGYGNQTGVFVPRIKAGGHDIMVAAFWGIQGAPTLDQDNILTLPPFVDSYLNDIIEAHADFANADAVITLIDPFVLQTSVYQKLAWCAWAPIDSEPILPATAGALRAARWIWSMSQFGHEQLTRAGFENVRYVPHGIDTKAFAPGKRDEARARLGKMWQRDLDGKFMVVMNSANKGTPSRKGFFEAFAAFKVFSDSHPEAVLYVHSEKQGVWHGEPLELIAEMVQLDPEKIIYAPQYRYAMGMLPTHYLADMYNTADVLLQTSHGEGFGLPIVEAQACGCPVVVTDFSAMSELCFSGARVPGMPFMHSAGATQRIPMIPGVIGGLEWAWDNRENESVREQARKGALDYDADVVYQKYMAPALASMAEEAARKPEVKVVRGSRNNPTPNPSPYTEREKGEEEGEVWQVPAPTTYSKAAIQLAYKTNRRVRNGR